jgi:hypothetical protein
MEGITGIVGVRGIEMPPRDRRTTAMMSNAQSRRALTDEALTAVQTLVWLALRSRYRQDRDLFTSCELAHLRFLRWLVRTGRLDS